MLFIFVSVGIIFLGIVITSILNRNSGTGVDIRARATESTGLEYFGAISETSADLNAIVVINLQPHDNMDVNFGTWIVTPPGGFNFSEYTVGTNISLKVDPETFMIDKHTVVAKEIEKR